jgi:glycosyltransferase 2 family protein
MDTVAGPGVSRKVSRWLVPAIGYAISLASLAWVFARFPYAEMGEHLRTMHWGWLFLAIGIEVGSFLLDAWRWRELLRPASAPSYEAAVQSVFAGLFVNDLLPARAGEAVRCFLLSYKTDIHLPLVITSLVILRVMDGICIVILYFATFWAVESPDLVTGVMTLYAAVVGALVVLLLFALFRRQHAHHFVSNSSWAARFAHFLDEIHNLGNWRELRIVMVFSGFYWVMQICAFWAIARAAGFYYNFGEMTYVFILKSVGTLVPTAPAGVGAFQAIIVKALEHFLTEPDQAKIVAELLFAFLTLPGLIGGGVAIAMAGYKLKDLVRHAQESHRKHKSGKP